MDNTEGEELLAIVARVAPTILASAVNQDNDVGSALRRAVGMMAADNNMINMQTFCIAFRVCLDLARHCNATLVTMDRVRKAALKEAPVGLPAVQTVLAMVRLTLATEARIISYMTFASRDEVDQVAKVMNEAFNETSERAADDLDSSTYMALVNLHGYVVKFLADSGRQLPRVINYKFNDVLPALRMAQRTYHNASRYGELITENNVVHPAFMPREGRMLSM